jgi:hypothetical protein
MTDAECIQTIDFLASVNDDPSPVEMEQLLHDIYIVVHSHGKSHSCYDVHTGWRNRAQELFNVAKQAGFIK